MKDQVKVRHSTGMVLAARAATCVAACAALWLALVSPARATIYTLTNPGDVVFGEDQTVVTVYEDTLYDLARAYSLGSEELIRVNQSVDPWLPGAGKLLVVPGRH